MGLTNFLKKKLEGNPEERTQKKRMDLALKREEEQARYEGRRKGTIERAHKEGYRQGQGGGGIMGGLANIGAHIDPTGGFGGGGLDFNPSANPFGRSPHGKPRSRSSRRSSGKGTTINVNGTTITVRNRQKNRRKRHREPSFPF